MTTLTEQILERVRSVPDAVWHPHDFRDLGSDTDVDGVLLGLNRDGVLKQPLRNLYRLVA